MPGLGLAMWGDARPLGHSKAAYNLRVDFASRKSLRAPRSSLGSGAQETVQGASSQGPATWLGRPCFEWKLEFKS